MVNLCATRDEIAQLNHLCSRALLLTTQKLLEPLDKGWLKLSTTIGHRYLMILVVELLPSGVLRDGWIQTFRVFGVLRLFLASISVMKRNQLLQAYPNRTLLTCVDPSSAVAITCLAFASSCFEIEMTKHCVVSWSIILIKVEANCI